MENINLSLISGDLLKEIYGDFAKPSVQSVGKALGEVFDIVFGGLSYYPKKGNILLKSNLEKYRKKLENVPVDNIITADPQIGVPIVEKLKYTKNDDISELFTTLLANASNSEKVESVHPAFISIIEQLAPDEAKIIEFLKGKDFVAYCDIKGIVKENRFRTLIKRATMIPFIVNLLYKDKEHVNTYIDNLIRLGILEDREGIYKIDYPEYDTILKYYNYDELKNKYVPNSYASIDVNKSYLEVTSFGKMLISACIKD